MYTRSRRDQCAYLVLSGTSTRANFELNWSNIKAPVGVFETWRPRDVGAVQTMEVVFH